jgi:hypothetical protein
MTTTHKPRRMAREPQPQNCEGPPAGGNREQGSTAELATLADPAPARVTKQCLLIEMLSQEGGASLQAIVGATGWQSHTARAALTGLRKKGHAIERFRGDEETRYRIVTSSAAISADAAHPLGEADDGAEAGTGAEADVDANGGAVA